MRRSHNNAEFLFYEDELIGINLGFDFTAEHEWGIKEIWSAFGIKSDSKVIGIERYHITHMPKTCFHYADNQGLYFFYISKSWVDSCFYETEYSLDKLANIIKEDYYKEFCHTKYTKAPFGAAWDSKSFAVMVPNPSSSVSHLSTIIDAFKRKDVAIWLGGTGGNPFARNGLCFGIISKIPDEHKKQMYDTHKEWKEIDCEHAIITSKYKLEERIRLCGIPYVSMSPKKIRPDLQSTSKYGIYYWVNPVSCNGPKLDAGYYTVEQLLEFIENFNSKRSTCNE